MATQTSGRIVARVTIEGSSHSDGAPVALICDEARARVEYRKLTALEVEMMESQREAFFQAWHSPGTGWVLIARCNGEAKWKMG